MSEHTKGPWRVRAYVNRSGSSGWGDAPDEAHYAIAAGGEKALQNKGHTHPDDAIYYDDEFSVVNISSDRDYYYWEGGIDSLADANLIAAAPELLEALKELVLEEFRDDDDPILDRARIKARNAIAKAEGRP